MSDKRPKDQAVRDRIIRDFDTSFAIEAGAGTGKTKLLTDRMIEAIRTGRATLAQIVAITFTDRAANELKVRLRTALEEGLGGAAPDEAERLNAALAGLDSAHTSTIHSFCAEMLRERPVEAEIDPGFDVADALQSDLLFEQAWERWLAEELKDEQGPLRAAFLAGVGIKQIRELAEFLRGNPDLRVAGEGIEVEAELDAFAPEFLRQARRMKEQLAQRCTSAECTCRWRMQECVRAAEEFEQADRACRAAFLPGLPDLGKRPQKTCKEHKGTCSAWLMDMEGLVGPFRGKCGHEVVRTVARLLGRMIGDYIAAKRQAALLDFDDLLLHARNVLRANKEVRAYFQSKYKMILVDEFQDTDPMQTEIVFFLGEDGACADDWRDVRLAPGRLVFVGDPKQSIYRFRRADIETYEDAKQILLRSGEVQHISQNFRSAEPCIRWVNAVFGELIRKPDDGSYQPEYVPLEASRGGDGPGVAILRPPEGFAAENVGEARTAEAAAVCSEILRMVGRGYEVFDKAAKARRPATFGDVAILFRTRTSFPIYEETLAAFGVPFRSVSGKDFFGKQEVAELRRVLNAVERPFDGLAVVAALRTSLLGVSDNELMRARGSRFNYLAAPPDEVGAADAVFGLLAKWHGQRAESSISTLVQAVLSETKALELFYLKPGGEQRAANLSKVVDLARSFEQTEGATFGGFVRWLDELHTAGDEAESPLVEEDGNFVKLITMHKAKGLEFPVVILADPAADPNSHSRPIVNRHNGTFHVQLGGAELNIRTLDYDEAKEFERLRAEAELQRLFYVGATRARDRLIIPNFPAPKSKGGYLKFLMNLAADAAAAAGAAAEEVVAAESDLAAPDYEGFRVPIKDAGAGECDAVLAARTRWAEERTALVARASAGRRIVAASSLEEAFRVAGSAATAASTEAMRIGTAVHAVLEQIDLRSGAGLEHVAEREAAALGVPAAVVEKLARNALALPLVRRAAKARHERELPFSLKAGDALLEGIVDVAFDDGAGIVILDYKTDDVAADGLTERAAIYRLQIGAYAWAAREAFGTAPAAAWLLFLRPGKEVEVKIDDALFRDVAERLNTAGMTR